MLAVITTLMGEGSDLGDRSVAFYIENNNALLEILKNSSHPDSIQATSGPIWRRIRGLNITPMFERAPPKRNIADLPTRSGEIKYKSLKRGGIPYGHRST